MKKFLNTHMMVSAHLLILALVIALASWIAHDAKKDSILKVTENIDRQIAHLSELAELTDRNGADEVVSKIITDCPRRSEFESLLVSLGTLDHKDLLHAQQLFESCGSFYSERKMLMVSRLGREYEVLVDNIKILEVLDSNDAQIYRANDWEELLSLEEDRSDLLTEEVIIERDIIASLISGRTATAPEVVGQVARARNIGESLGVLNKKIDDLRAQLIK